MPLVSASNENQAKYCALMFLGVSLKIAGRRPAISKLNTVIPVFLVAFKDSRT